MGKLIADRHQRVLDAATNLARKVGYQWIMRKHIAQAAGVSAGSVTSAYGSMLDLKREVLRNAVATGDLKILRQGLADGHPIALSAPEDLKVKAALSMLEK